MSRTGSQLLLVLVLVGLVLAGWFLLPGLEMPALALGVLVGAATAFILFRDFGAASGSLALGIIVALVLFGFLLVSMTRSELGYIELGEMEGRLRAAAYAVAGLFGGIALRVAWRAMAKGR